MSLVAVAAFTNNCAGLDAAAIAIIPFTVSFILIWSFFLPP